MLSVFSKSSGEDGLTAQDLPLAGFQTWAHLSTTSLVLPCFAKNWWKNDVDLLSLIFQAEGVSLLGQSKKAK